MLQKLDLEQATYCDRTHLHFRLFPMSKLFCRSSYVCTEKDEVILIKR